LAGLAGTGSGVTKFWP